MRLPSALVLVAGALVALAAWPTFIGGHRAPVTASTPAPVVADYLLRDRLIAFYERQVKAQPADQIKGRMLAQLYMQRYRERFDLGDIDRARALAIRSIALQPQGNTSAQMTLASTYLSYHDFGPALRHERLAWEGEPFNNNALAQIASIQMEVGEYDSARKTLDSIPSSTQDNPTVDSVWARYAELTGDLRRARLLIDRGIRSMDAVVDNPAYDRSWFHTRAAQLAMEAGDDDAARSEFATALSQFPDNALALMWQAKLYRSEGRWNEALASADKSAALYPLPQVLGYKADAQRALGDSSGAAQTDALIYAEERLYNAQGVNDRLLANYYAQRRVRLNVALRAARDDYRRRGDEIYADDTLAWVLARMNRWNDARSFAERAVRLGTTDPELQFHAGVVALHTGHVREAKARIAAALTLSDHFDPIDAPDARAELAKLDSQGARRPI